MYVRIFVAGESNVTKLPSFARFNQRGIRSFRVKDTMWIVKPDNFMMLDQIDVVDSKATQRFFKLFARLLLGPSIDLGHHKRTVAVAVTQCPAHAFFTRAIVVVPGVVEEVNASIDG